MHALLQVTGKNDFDTLHVSTARSMNMAECISHSTLLQQLISASMPGTLHGGQPELRHKSTLPLNEGCLTTTDAQIQQVLLS